MKHYASAESVMSRVADSIRTLEKNQDVAHFTKYMKGKGMFENTSFMGVQAGLMNNFQSTMDKFRGAGSRVSDSYAGLTPMETVQGVTHLHNVGPYIPEIWPIIVAWYPDFPLKDLISVQSMEQPLAYLLYSELKVGTNKAPATAGDIVSTPMGMRSINVVGYSTGKVMGENIPAEQVAYDDTAKTITTVLAFQPLLPEDKALAKLKLDVTVDGTLSTYVAAGVSGNNINLALSTSPTVPVTGAYVDGIHGIVVIPQATAPTAATMVANYWWNIDLANDANIPKIVEDITKRTIEAEPHAVEMQWTVFAEAVKQAQFGTNFKTENTKRVLNVLYQMQTRDVLSEMWTYATGTMTDPADQVIAIPTNSYSLDTQVNYVLSRLNAMSSQIGLNSGRMEGNRIVVGYEFKNWLEALPATWFKKYPEPAGFLAPHAIGEFGKYIVFYDPQAAGDEAFMTYRGSEWYDAAMYMGVFLPFVPTDAVAVGVRVREAFVSMYATDFHKPDCVIKFTVERA